MKIKIIKDDGEQWKTIDWDNVEILKDDQDEMRKSHHQILKHGGNYYLRHFLNKQQGYDFFVEISEEEAKELIAIDEVVGFIEESQNILKKYH